MGRQDDGGTKGLIEREVDSKATREVPSQPGATNRLVMPKAATSEDDDQDEETPAETPVALRLEREGLPPAMVALDPGISLRFGRDSDSSWVFPAEEVSRQHGRLDFTGSRWSYRDLGSRNGSFLVRSSVPAGDDPRRHGRELRPNRDTWPVPGDCILLGNGDSRIVFLAEVPPELVRPRSADGRSPATVALERSITVCAAHRLPVVLLGRSGSGKTWVARAIHERSRLPGPFINLNCGRLPSDSAQLASELLGHIKGAFTGAIGERTGKLWAADGGTLFLDELESMQPKAQDFFLDLLEGVGDFAPLGSSGASSAKAPRFRLLSASKTPLAKSGLRTDLCQRLAAGDVIALPTLAARRDDIPSLIAVFVRAVMVEQGVEAEVTPEAVAFLKEAPWAGEVRELEATVRAVLVREVVKLRLGETDAKRITVGLPGFQDYLAERAEVFGAADADLPPEGKTVVFRLPSPVQRADGAPTVKSRAVAAADAAKAGLLRRRPADLTVADVEAALDAHGGNKTLAAKALGIAVNTLKAKLKK